MTSNQPTIEDEALEFRRDSRRADLEAYDALPRPLRVAIAEAPLLLAATHALEHYEGHGVMSTLREIEESERLFYAACERETGIPAPSVPLARNPRRRR